MSFNHTHGTSLELAQRRVQMTMKGMAERWLYGLLAVIPFYRQLNPG